MGNLFDNEDWEIEDKLRSTFGNVNRQEMEQAKKVYHLLKKLGYIDSPSELHVGCPWVSEKYYFEPRTERIDLAGYGLLLLTNHPNGMCSHAIKAQYMGNSLFQFLSQNVAKNRSEAIAIAKEALLSWCEHSNVPQDRVQLIKTNIEESCK